MSFHDPEEYGSEALWARVREAEAERDRLAAELAAVTAERDRLRDAIRFTLGVASGGDDSPVDWSGDVRELLLSYYRGADERAEAFAAERDALRVLVKELAAELTAPGREED